MAVPLKGGGGQRLAIIFKKVPTAIKLEVERGKALMALPLRK